MINYHMISDILEQIIYWEPETNPPLAKLM